MPEFPSYIVNNATAYMLVSDAGSGSFDPWRPLIDLPESSPGAQVVIVEASDSGYREAADEIPSGTYFVFNCEFFVLVPPEQSGDAAAHFFPQTSYGAFVSSFALQYRTKLGGVSSVSPVTPRSTLITPANTSVGEKYWRMSAYANDRRITADRELVAGTYVTTDSDVEFIASGLGAVGRYALPNPFPSIYGFQVTPYPGRRITLGTVRPNYGQAGGGVEGVFQDPTGKWSVSNHMRVLPAW